MRLLHTGDWHLGRRYSVSDHAMKEVLEKSLWQFAKDLLQCAQNWQVDVLLLAGDTLDDTQAGVAPYAQLAELLRSVSYPVVILPGNHDPYVAGGLWDQVTWPSHVKILQDDTPVRLSQEVFLHGLPWHRRVMERPVMVQVPSVTGGIHLLLHHGDVHRGAYRPLGETAAYDYVALGHIHQPQRVTEHMAYSGSPWALHGGDTGPKGVWLLEIEDVVRPRFQPLSYRLAHSLTPVDELPKLEKLSWDFYRGTVTPDEELERFLSMAPLAQMETMTAWDDLNAAVMDEIRRNGAEDGVVEAVMHALKAVTPCS